MNWRSIASVLIASLRPAELHSESLALVDMLVLIQARKFVGFDMSTLSWCAVRTGSKVNFCRAPPSAQPWMT